LLGLHRVSKKQPKLFSSELRQISTNFDNVLAKRWPTQQNCVRCTHFPPHLIYVNALPHKTQMFDEVLTKTILAVF